MGGQEDPGDAPVLRNELDDLLADSRASLVKELEATTTAHLNTTLRAFDAMQTREFERIQGDVSETKDRVQSLESSLKDTIATVETLKHQMAIAEKVVYDLDEDNDAWSRDARREILLVGTAEIVAKTTLLESLSPWLDELGLDPGFFRLDGPPAGRNFQLVFTGAPSIGARRARKANNLLRQEDGTWRKLVTQDPEGEETKIFISPDASPKSRREKQLCKRLVRSFQHLYSSKNFFYNSRTKVACCDGKPLARICADSFEDFRTEWVLSNLAAKQVDKDTVASHFANASGTAAGVTWSL